jgi:hypothetical protein
VAARLGWRPERLEAPLPPAARTDAVYAVLSPTRPLSGAESHQLLELVRRGAGLLVVPAAGSLLADSLGVRVSSVGGVVPLPPRGNGCAPGSAGPQAITWYDGRIHSWWVTPRRAVRDSTTFVRVRHRPTRVTPAAGPDDEDEEEEIAGDSLTSAGALGFALGRGRVVVVADPDLLRNDVIRVCRWGAGVAATRMLAWLGGTGARGGRALVFDEYHHGYGAREGGLGLVWRGSWHSPTGRTVVAFLAAALVLLVALGPRALAPHSRARVQRRSALEHVGALARAYEQVGATRTAVRLIVRGVRRRHPAVAPAGPRASAESDFLTAVAARRPALAADTERVRAALDAPVAPPELLAVGQAVARIDAALGA